MQGGGERAHDDAGERRHHDGEHGRLGKLTHELDLTPEQVEKIRAGLKPKAESSLGSTDSKLVSDVDARLAAFSTAFAGESFDAKTLSAWEPEDSHLVSAGMTRLVRFCEVITPILTPEQRTKFAASLREHRLEPVAGK
jgi:Spy/CpxP family protein refolding chaperone